MTSYELEVIAKNAIIDTLKKNYNEELKIEVDILKKFQAFLKQQQEKK